MRARYHMSFIVPNAYDVVESSVRISEVTNGGPIANNMYVPGNPQWATPAHTNLQRTGELALPVDSWHALITLDPMLPVVANFLSETWVRVDLATENRVLAEVPLFHLVRERCLLSMAIPPQYHFVVDIRFPSGTAACKDLLEHLKNPHAQLVAAAHLNGLPVPPEWSITDAAIRLGADVPMQRLRGWIILEGGA